MTVCIDKSLFKWAHKKKFSFSPTLKGGKFLKNSSKLHPLGIGEINFDEF
ncbi:hypothetical protein NBC122_02868 [Chryseobacterium salivictor]|uniref:Uncharacterized protein n=1 Tax=Chryseobacterium salivictor TaxID=2547600 RepID=A0A4P6ZJ21_9FLAO|nr:hypothetical protein NBC122_02868 [Chryseobacterium salivictor]